ncbi:MAG: hypothetical protein IJK63_00330 [Oscillospiraceae bacterium]|nr:hypothetical protein [Oscillospiraceae bacterium]
MRKQIRILVLCLLLPALCACGGDPAAPAAEARPAEAEARDASATEAAADRPEIGAPTLPDAGLHPAEEKPGEEPEIAARRELAREYLDRDAAELIEALGEPLERNYAPSCLGSGEDGELVYEGFTVYTYREGDRETVTDVS